MQEIVKDIMSEDIVAVLPSDTAREAAVLMNENNIGSVPVVLDRKLQGILTDRDIVVRCIAKGRSVDSTKVSDLMSTDIVVVKPEDTVSDAVNLMAEERVRRLPVVKDGIINGFVSLADIARHHSGPETAEAISEISLPNCVSNETSIKTE
ncbi:MAG: CBS domain-containing protein [Eubacteriales bacterium SKADARSKE-1]|nr:CBS domain-containing protein [Eubacteriales bacterium SKADARSKE-1]